MKWKYINGGEKKTSDRYCFHIISLLLLLVDHIDNLIDNLC